MDSIRFKPYKEVLAEASHITTVSTTQAKEIIVGDDQTSLKI